MRTCHPGKLPARPSPACVKSCFRRTSFCIEISAFMPNNHLFRTAVFSLIASAGVWAQKPDAGHYSEAKYKVKVIVGTMVAMRDGVRLSVDVYRPDAPGPFP